MNEGRKEGRKEERGRKGGSGEVRLDERKKGRKEEIRYINQIIKPWKNN